MLQSESLPIMAWFDVYISKYFCYFNRQGGSSHGWETFHIRHLEMEPWSGSHEVQYLRKMEPRWMQSKEFSPVMSSQGSKSEREELAAGDPYQATWDISWAGNNVTEIGLPSQVYHALPRQGCLSCCLEDNSHFTVRLWRWRRNW